MRAPLASGTHGSAVSSSMPRTQSAYSPAPSLGGSYAPSRRTTLLGGVARVGQTTETRSEPDRRGSGGGSWGRSSGGFGG